MNILNSPNLLLTHLIACFQAFHSGVLSLAKLCGLSIITAPANFEILAICLSSVDTKTLSTDGIFNAISIE